MTAGPPSALLQCMSVSGINNFNCSLIPLVPFSLIIIETLIGCKWDVCPGYL